MKIRLRTRVFDLEFSASAVWAWLIIKLLQGPGPWS